MNKSVFSPRFFFVATIILIAAISRLFPHIYNFTPIAAMALAGGIYLNNRALAFIMPMLAMFISDCFLEITTGWGFHNTMIYVYTAFALTTFIGIYVRKNARLQNVLAASFVSSVLFFIVTNFGVWAASGFMNGTTGLVQTYVLGIPFFGATMVGDLFFNTLIFGILFFAQKRFVALQN